MKKTNELENVSRETFSANAVLIGEMPIPTGIVTKDINGKEVTCFESSFDMGERTTTITCYDEKLAKDLSVLLISSNVDAMLGLRKAVACYNLRRDDNWKLVSGDFKSFGDMTEKMFNIKRDTAVSYARVAEYFLTFTDGEEVGYKSELYKGASLANMLQLLGMVDDESTEPMKWIDEYILKGMLHITASLSKLKSDIDDVKSDVNYGGKNKKSDKKTGKGGKKPDKGALPEKTTAQLLSELLDKVGKIEDSERQEECKTLIARLGELIG